MAEQQRTQVILSAKDQTAAAFATAKQNLANLKTSTDGLAGRFGSLGLAIAGAFEAVSFKSLIDNLDTLNKLSQRTGIATEALSAFSYAGGLSDVSTETLAASLKKLAVNMDDAARGGTQTGAAFKAIGVGVTDASGKLRATDKVLLDIADRFAGYKDGAAKAALAVQIFGKAGDQLIPFLNQGKGGLQALRVEAERLGVSFSGNLTKQAEEFNDNLRKLNTAANGAKTQLLTALLPSLVATSEAFVEATKNAGLFKGALITLGGGIAQRLGLDDQGELESKAKAQSNALAMLATQIDRYQHFADNGSDSAKTRVTELRAQFAAMQSEAAKSSSSLKAMADVKTFGDHPITIDHGVKPDGPSAGNKEGAANAEALLRKQLDGRIKAIEASLEREHDLFQFADQKLAELYAHGDLSIAQFYDAKNKAQADSLAKQQKGFDDEIAALKAYQAKAAKPQEKQDAENQIADVLAKQAKAYREAGQAAETAETQRGRATEDFRKSLVNLDAQIAELSGNKYGAELLRNTRTLEDAKKMLLAGGAGGDPEREASLARLLKLQAEFGAAQEATGRAAEAAQIAEERFRLEAERTGLSRADTERGIMAIREQELVQIDKQIALLEQLGKTSFTGDQTLALERLKLLRDQVYDVKDSGFLRFREAAREAGETIAQGFEDAIVQGGKFRDLLKGVEKDLVRLVTREAITKPLGDSITGFIRGQGSGMSAGSFTSGSSSSAGLLAKGIGLFAGLFGGSTQAAFSQTSLGGSGFGSGLAYGNQDLGQYFHNGGVAGEAAGNLRAINPAALAYAERYHKGGKAGFGPDEIPAILQRGEEVLRADDPRHRDNGGLGESRSQRPIVVNVTATPNMSRASANQQGVEIGRGIQRAMARNG